MPLQNSFVEVLTHIYDGISRWGLAKCLLGHEGGAPMNGISVLIKEDPRDLLPLPPGEDIVRGTIYEQGNGPSPEQSHIVAFSWTSQPPELRKINASVLTHSALKEVR